MEPIYIFGHKNPDTDSVCAAIAYAYLKNALGIVCEPRVIGHINNETKFVLKYFQLSEPNYLSDVKIQIKDLNFNRKAVLKKDTTLKEAIAKMLEFNITGIPVVLDNKKIYGYINFKDVGRYLISDELQNLTLEKCVEEIFSNKNPIIVDRLDYFNDFLKKSSKLPHTNYPVINNKNECVGLITLNDFNRISRKQVILVDHNQFLQSVDGIEEADILEIIDHHNIGTMGTNNPINFRIMPVGSTCTIIYGLFKEANIGIPRSIAGTLLSGILSDTMILTSPTTTEIDKNIANTLAEFLQINIQEFSIEMFKAGSTLKGMSVDEILFNDYKDYKIGDNKIFLSQMISLDFGEVESKLPEFIEELNRLSKNEYKYAVLLITDVTKNGSHLVYSESAKQLIMDAYALNDIEEGIFIPGLVSRKKQLVPNILEILK